MGENRYFKRQGSEVIEKISDSRTASPNLWWTPEQMTAHGFTECQPDAATLLAEKVEAFSIEPFQEGLFGALMQEQFSSPSVRSEFDKICAFAVGTKRFALMKQYLGWLISINCVTEGDYAIVAGLLMEQGIDLNAV